MYCSFKFDLSSNYENLREGERRRKKKERRREKKMCTRAERKVEDLSEHYFIYVDLSLNIYTRMNLKV